MRQRLVLFATLASGLGSLAACHGDAVGPQEIVFTYTLSYVGSLGCLPYTLSQTPDETVEIVDGTFDWYSDSGRYTYSYVLQTTAGEITTETVSDSGSWNLQDGAIVLTSDQDGRQREAGLGPSAISFMEQGIHFAFYRDARSSPCS